MSLLNAKRIADLTDQVEVESKKMATKHHEFRNRMDEEVIGAFTDYLQENDFQVTKASSGAKGAYKGLTVELRLPQPDETYMGIYHSFAIFVDGKEKFVRVIPKFKGDSSDRPPIDGDKAKVLEFQLAQLQKGLTDLELESFKFDCVQRTQNQRSEPVLKNSIPEVLDYFLA